MRAFVCPKQSPDCKPGSRDTSSPNVLDPQKAYTLDQRDKVPNGDRSSNSVRPGFKTARDFRREIFLEDNIRKLKATIGLQDTVNLLEALLLQR